MDKYCKKADEQVDWHERQTEHFICVSRMMVMYTECEDGVEVNLAARDCTWNF